MNDRHNTILRKMFKLSREIGEYRNSDNAKPRADMELDIQLDSLALSEYDKAQDQDIIGSAWRTALNEIFADKEITLREMVIASASCMGTYTRIHNKDGVFAAIEA